MERFRIGLVRSPSELVGVGKLRSRVFSGEIGVVNPTIGEVLVDDWDTVSYNAVVYRSDDTVGAGRVIYNPGKLGFRVSSSIDIASFLGPTSNIAEISALAVGPSWRNQGIGNCIHLFRFLLARNLKAKFLIASCLPGTVVHLKELGFEILCENFVYGHYGPKAPKSTFLALSYDSKMAVDAFNRKISSKLTSSQIRIIETAIEHELARGLFFLPLKKIE